MKAVWYESQGSAEDVLVFGDTADPAVRPGEVLVRLRTSGCNPSDVKLRGGARPMGFERIIPHSDGAGLVEDVGAGVDPGRIGQRVWLWNGQWRRPFGTCAEFIALPASQAVVLPDGVGFAEGACLGIPAMTAHRCVFSDGPVEGKTVLVTGGAGTVARYAIQLAALHGATVIATVSNSTKAAYAHAAGAHHVLNYRQDDVASAITDLTGGVDRIIELEFGANLPVTEQIIRPNGVIAAYGSARAMTPTLPFYPLMFKDVTVRMVLVYLLSDEVRRTTLSGLTSILESGHLTHSVARRFDLEDAAKAHRAVEHADKMGSVVIVVP